MVTVALTGVHHVTFPVSDLEAGTAWYGAVPGARRDYRLDHHDPDGALFAVVLWVPGLPMPVQLRLGPALSAGAEFGPVTFGVADEDALRRWVAHLDACSAPHSPVTAARTGLSVQFADPDGTPLRLVTDPVGGFDAAVSASASPGAATSLGAS